MPVEKLKNVNILTKNTIRTLKGLLKATKAIGKWKYLSIGFSLEGLTSLDEHC